MNRIQVLAGSAIYARDKGPCLFGGSGFMEAFL